jgi:DNA-binding transcriptional MocR family regulator
MSSTSLDPYSGLYAQRTGGLAVSEIRALFSVANRPEVVSLAGGSPYVSALPLDQIADLVRELIATNGARALQYCGGQGDERLRELICDVMAEEGVEGSADDIVVTVGSQQALDLLARVFLDPGDIVLAEGPSYVGALGVFAAAQADVRHVPMDEQGLIPDALAAALERLEAEGRRAKFLYTVPNFHNPAGVTLTVARRQRIVEIAERHDVLILEDNPYGLLGFDREPEQALRSMSDSHVIYLGSFSKTFASGLRVGWVFAPPAVREKLVLLTEAQVLCPPMLTQLTVVEYLTKHPWRDQVKVFREVYRERRDAMLESLDALMPAGCSWTKPDGGFYVWLTAPEGIDTKVMQPRAIHARVAYVPGIGFYADGNGRRNIRLSYCFPPPDRIREGVRRLAGVMEEELELRATFGPAGEGSAESTVPESAGQSAPGPDVA